MRQRFLAELVAEVDECVRDGYGNATLIPWDGNATKAIVLAHEAFEADGWEWNLILEQLERRGWYAFFRSQGELSAPIIQWQRVSKTPQYVSPNVQFSLF